MLRCVTEGEVVDSCLAFLIGHDSNTFMSFLVDVRGVPAKSYWGGQQHHATKGDDKDATMLLVVFGCAT
jgi:hypothetical protein